jgi:DNA damage-binding protein 1
MLLSFCDSSRLIRVNDGGENISFAPFESGVANGLITVEPTVAFANVAQRVKGQDGKARYMNSSLVVQVTGSCACLLELDQGLQAHIRIDEWNAKKNVDDDFPPEIVAASINSSQVALAISGGKLALLSVAEDKKFRVVV